MTAAEDIGLPVTVILPTKVWRGQVAKRTQLYTLAADGSDWIITLDADHILHGIREAVRHELDEITQDACEVEFYTTVNHDRPLSDAASTEWHEELAGKSIWHRMVLRALPDMRVERYHWYVSALRDGERVWLRDVSEGGYPVVDTHRLRAPFLIEHRCMFRRDRNILANRSFCRDRELLVAATGEEDPAA
jgi:hypothetical protein